MLIEYELPKLTKNFYFAKKSGWMGEMGEMGEMGGMGEMGVMGVMRVMGEMGEGRGKFSTPFLTK